VRDTMTRRNLLALAGGLAASQMPLPAKRSELKIGVTDWNLRKGANPESVALAASLGFDGVEISFGRASGESKLPLDNDEILGRYLEEFKKHKIVIAGTCVDVLHVNCLMNDKLAQQWVADAIRMSHKLGSKVLLMPSFGKCAMQTPADRDGTAAALRDLAKEAQKAGVTLGLENTISARDNVEIMEKVGSRALKVYYDAANSARAGHDPYEEIQWLGADRICQFHIKDNPHYLGEGNLHWDRLMDIILGLGFVGFANLETDSPSKIVAEDMKRNLAYVRHLTAR
jgi:L-ribulose-5-phosphate 3-epimerase